MIARDEAAGVARALESAAAHVDAMIVVDTGSTDATPDIAARCGAQVHRMAWPDDFSAARNHALDRSPADWNLILDADEWIEGDAGALAELRSEPFIGHVRVASLTDQGAGPSRAWIPRVLPRGVRYEGRIHEQPVSDLPGRRLALTLGHAGYLPEALARKGGRNETLLLAEVEAHPQDGYLWFQLGKEYQAREKPPQAAVCLAEALRLGPADAPWRHALVVRAITALKTAERFEEAITLADGEVANWSHSPDFYFAVGDLYLDWAGRNPDRALSDLLPVAELAWKRCLEIGERDDLDGSVAGRGGHMAAHNLAVLHGGLGQADLAAHYEALAARLRLETGV